MSNTTTEPVRYLLGAPRTRTGLGGLPARTTVVVGVGFFLFVVMTMFKRLLFGLFVILPVTAVIAALTFFQVGRRSIFENFWMIGQSIRRRLGGEDWYVSGGLSQIPGGTYRLPGMLARTRVASGMDIRGKEFAVIVDEPARLATVVLTAFLSGQSAMTTSERNDLTASWGGWLASLSLAGDIEAAAVTVATRPSSGQLLKREVESILADDGPALAQQILREASTTLTQGVPELSAHIAVTFRIDGATLKDDGFIDMLATRIPTVYEAAGWAGIQAEPATEIEVIAMVHQAFVPQAEADMEELLVEGLDHGMGWQDAGPSIAHVTRDTYQHEGVVSRTWEMVQAPRSAFEDTILRGLCAPHGRVPRKRVTLVYRPFESGQGAKLVEAEHRDALVAANTGRQITKAAAMVRLEMTEVTRAAQARGAQLGRYSLFVTATVASDEELDKVTQDIEQLASSSAIRLRPMTMQQDVGFEVALGVGQLPWDKSTGPQFNLPGM